MAEHSILRTTSIFGLVCSVVGHVLAFSSIAPEDLQWVGFVLVVGVICFMRAIVITIAAPRSDSPNLDRLHGPIPKWYIIALVCAFLYQPFSAFYNLGLNEGGTPQRRGNEFVLQQHGRVIRQLSEEEYTKHWRYNLRFLFGVAIPMFGAAYAMVWPTDSTWSDAEARSRTKD